MFFTNLFTGMFMISIRMQQIQISIYRHAHKYHCTLLAYSSTQKCLKHKKVDNPTIHPLNVRILKYFSPERELTCFVSSRATENIFSVNFTFYCRKQEKGTGVTITSQQRRGNCDNVQENLNDLGPQNTTKGDHRKENCGAVDRQQADGNLQS